MTPTIINTTVMKNSITKVIFCTGIIFLISSCVPKSDYESLKSDYEQIKKELEDCKYGADRLLKGAQKYFNNKEYDNCIASIQDLENRHPGSNEYTLGLELRKKAELAKKQQVETERRAKEEGIRKEKQRLAQATSLMRKKYDEMTGITWYYDKSSPQYVNSKTNLHAYIGKIKEDSPWLRLNIQYVADDWLFIEKYIIKVDDKTYTITEDGYGEIKTDCGSGRIWEWLDRKVSYSEYEIIEAIANGENVKIRFSGKDYYKDRTISIGEKIALKNVLNAYEALGGTKYK
jgi:hypothetical protein